MNICLANDSFPPLIDGVANTVVNYATVIQKKYGNAIVATPKYPKVKDNYPFQVVRYPSVNTNKIFGYRMGYPFSGIAMSKIKNADIDLIHTHCPIISTLLAREVREITNAPIIFTYHTKFDIDIRKAIRGKYIQDTAIKYLVKNIEACDEVWVVSEGAGKNLKDLGFSGDYIVMENGVDMSVGQAPKEKIDEIKVENNIPDGIPVFLFVGRMKWYKGIKIILDALAAIKDEFDFRMALVGDGDDREEMQDYANEVGVANKCIFTGAIHDREVLRIWYSAADLFLFPSTYDTNGIVVREAVACSLASVLVKGSCAAEGITDGENGILIDENPQSLAEALREICKNPEKTKILGNNAMQTLYISWEQSIDKAYERYCEVVNKPNIKKPATFDKGIEFVSDTYKAFSKVHDLRSKVNDGVQQGVERAKQAYKDEYKRVYDKFNDKYTDESDRYL